MGFIAAAIIGAAGISAGVSISQGNRQAGAAKNASQAVEQQNSKAIQDVKDAQASASTQAQSALDAKRRASNVTQSVYTSPLGITTQAETAKKTLLGA